MNRYFFKLTAMLFSFTLLFGCGAKSNQQKASDEASANVQTEDGISQSKNNKQLIGGDRDEHGCIASAGYQWSELLKDCIRPFEKGAQLKSTDEKSTSAAYLVFNNDSSKIEVFMPENESHPILNRTKTTKGDFIWSDEDVDKLSVRCVKNVWGIYINNVLHYAK